jgi:hypothetical protein
MRFTKAPEYPVIDGFALSTRLGCDLTFISLVMAEFDHLRRAGAMRSKYWPVPPDSNVVIPAYDSYEYQLAVKPGSAIFGYIFIRQSGVTDYSGNLSMRIVNGCDDVAVQSEAQPSTVFTANNAQVPLAKLLIVSEPGLLNITIANTSAVNLTGIQVILCGGEPV